MQAPPPAPGRRSPREQRVLERHPSPRGDEVLLAVVQEVVERVRARRGMSRSRRAWSGAWRDTASVLCSLAWASASSDPRTPTVLMVMCLAPIPTSALRASCALRTLGTFSNGSPIPMNTTFVTLRPKCSSRDITWSTISWGARLRADPPFARGTERAPHRAADLGRDARGEPVLPPSVAGMPTVSTTRSSPRRRSNFAVPSAAAAMVCTDDRPTATFAAASSARMDLDNVVRSSMSRAGFAPYRWSRSCLPSNAGHPRSVARFQLGRRQAEEVEGGGGSADDGAGGVGEGARMRHDRILLRLLHEARVEGAPRAIADTLRARHRRGAGGGFLAPGGFRAGVSDNVKRPGGARVRSGERGARLTRCAARVDDVDVARRRWLAQMGRRARATVRAAVAAAGRSILRAQLRY